MLWLVFLEKGREVWTWRCRGARARVWLQAASEGQERLGWDSPSGPAEGIACRGLDFGFLASIMWDYTFLPSSATRYGAVLRPPQGTKTIP